MPYPTPILTELNLLFENPPLKSLLPANVRTSTFTPPPNDHDTESPASPASSTSTLVSLEDEEIRNIFAAEKYLAFKGEMLKSPSTPTTPPEELNPLAAPFVPSPRAQSLGRAALSPPRATKPPAQEAARPVWYDAFSRGTRTSSTAEHRTLAISIVAPRRWPVESMAELAQHFCWRGSEKIAEDSANIAPFALVIYRQFFEVYGEEVAQSFVWHLRECVVGAFKACWDPDCSNAISFNNPPSFNYVASAIAQATFVGQLFKCDLIPGPYTAACIVTLLKGLNSYEHLEALRAIISAAGPSFWHGPGTPGLGNTAIHRFVATFLETVAPVNANMSVLGRSLKPNDMHDIITEIETMVTGWVYDSVRRVFAVDARAERLKLALSVVRK
ncbi:hypothetical protein R3P38DRAFT_3020395 [Favolaschia claudopus]|uniref:Uncharacterized protein n=1 Tax=Favolaschia claudopus TaxID=2862362 RepID=A0AAW0AHR9_9AGAR